MDEPLSQFIVGLSGWARSGKDSFAGFLVEQGFVQAAFADPIREALLRIDPLVHVTGEPPMPLSSLIKSPSDWGWAKDNTLDVRGLLQRLGSEFGREMFGEDFWVNYALSRATDPLVVISDVRYQNEAEAIRARGGVIVRIERDGVGPANDHASENEMTDYQHFVATVYNDRDLQHLKEVAGAFLQVVGIRG